MAQSYRRVVIISGASRGLGAALANQLLAPNDLLISLARKPNPSLDEAALALGAAHHFIQSDLSNTAGIQQAQTQLAKLLPNNAQAYWLINNAGTVDPVALCSKLSDPVAISHSLNLNLSAVMCLCATFLQQLASLDADKRILNISSGAGRRPVAGWAVYGASKAALDYYTQTLAAEDHNVRCAALAPGVIDTSMQAHIRQQSRDDFPGLSRFIDLHQNQELVSADDTARQIIKYLESREFGHHVIDDIRHYS